MMSSSSHSVDKAPVYKKSEEEKQQPKEKAKELIGMDTFIP